MITGDTISEIAKSTMIIYQDKKNNYWFGTNGEGVFRYDGNNLIQFTTEHGLCHNKIVQIEEDNYGNIYFNTDIGISKFDGQRFTTLNISNKEDNEWKLTPDDLWFKGAQDSGLVYRYDGKILHRLQFPKTNLGEKFVATYPRALFPNMTFSPYDVYTIYKDSKGYIWLGTGNLGVCRYDGKFFNWISEEDVIEIGDGPSNGVRSNIEDKDGYFWFSNTLFRYNIYQNIATVKSTSDIPEKSEFNYSRQKGIGSLDNKPNGNLDAYLSATKDNNNVLWISTYNAGVWKYDGNNITAYPIEDGKSNTTIFSIYKNNYGNLWLGTHNAGPYKFNAKTFEKFIF